MRSRAALVLALTLTLLSPWTSAQPGGTPAKPAANPLFQDTRVVTVNLTFTSQEFAGLRPVRVAGGGSRESWLQGAEGHRNGLSASRGIEFPYVHATATIDGNSKIGRAHV